MVVVVVVGMMVVVVVGMMVMGIIIIVTGIGTGIMANAKKVGIEGYCCYLVAEQGERRLKGEKMEVLD